MKKKRKLSMHRLIGFLCTLRINVCSPNQDMLANKSIKSFFVFFYYAFHPRFAATIPILAVNVP